MMRTFVFAACAGWAAGLDQVPVPSTDECEATPCAAGQICYDPSSADADYTCFCSNGVVATGASATCDEDECKAPVCGTAQVCKDPDYAANSLHDFICICITDPSIEQTGGPATCVKNECDATPCCAGQACNDPNTSPKVTGDYTCACNNGVSATGACATCEEP